MESSSLPPEVIHPIHFLFYVPDVDTAMSLCQVSKVYHRVANHPDIIARLRVLFGVKCWCYSFPCVVQAVDRKVLGKRSHLHMSPQRLLRKAAIAGLQEVITQAEELGAVFDAKSLEKAAANGHIEIVNKYIHKMISGARYAARGYSTSLSRFPENRTEMMKMIIKDGCTEGWDDVALNLAKDNQVEALIPIMKAGLTNIADLFHQACREGKIEVATQLAGVFGDYVPSHLEFLRGLDKLKEYVGILQETTDHFEFLFHINDLLDGAEVHNLQDIVSYLRERGAVLTGAAVLSAFSLEDDRLVKIVLQQFSTKTIIEVLEDTEFGVTTIHPRHANLLADHGVVGLKECVKSLSDEQVMDNIEGIRRCANYDPKEGLNLDGCAFRAAVRRGKIEDIEKAFTKGIPVNCYQMIEHAARKGMKRMLEYLLKKIGEHDGLATAVTIIKRDILHRVNHEGQQPLKVLLDKDIIKILS